MSRKKPQPHKAAVQASDDLPVQLRGPGLHLDAMIAWLARAPTHCPRSKCRRVGYCLAVGCGPVSLRAPLPPCRQNAAGQASWNRARDQVLAEFWQQVKKRLRGRGRRRVLG